MSGPAGLGPGKVGTERVCDDCGSVMACYSMKAQIGPHPKEPRKDTIALVISVTRTPPEIDGEPNPNHNPGDAVPVAWLEGRFDFCDRDCLANIMDKLWANAERRRKRLWSQTEETPRS
jgi:hypothetical protein